MLTEGRLRAIKSYYARRVGYELMVKITGELIEQVEHLEECLRKGRTIRVADDWVGFNCPVFFCDDRGEVVESHACYLTSHFDKWYASKDAAIRAAKGPDFICTRKDIEHGDGNA